MKGGTGACAMPLAAIALAPFKLRRKSNIPFDHAVGNSRRGKLEISSHASLTEW